ncbi:MAG: hypothetical protein H6Q52_3669 [Deltaproteobacteria bacterium]|nr:hypothetical protein [Deltaproteobacteria bacterium]
MTGFVRAPNSRGRSGYRTVFPAVIEIAFPQRDVHIGSAKGLEPYLK